MSRIPPQTTSTSITTFSNNTPLSVLTTQQQPNNTNYTVGGQQSAAETVNTSADKTLTEHDLKRMREFGKLFNRHSSINRALLEELFRKEPSEYTQTVYQYASRIFHCLKADLTDNPVLKALTNEKEQQQKKNMILDVPKIDYANEKEKRRTLKLAFSVLRYQKVVEDLLDETQFFSLFPDLKDEYSLVCTILYDYLSRKFQIRDDPADENEPNNNALITQIENSILQEKTRLAAALARNRIKAQALSIEELLPESLREVQQHGAELPVYCWVNLIKTDMNTVLQVFENDEQMTRVYNINDVQRKTFMVDFHCPNLLIFHYSQKHRISNHRLVKEGLLYLQDKSSCIAATTVTKLLTKKDNILVAYVSGGLLVQLLLSLTNELESKIYAFGARTDENLRDLQGKMKQFGVEKRVKIFKERFIDANLDEMNMENIKVILCNPPCSRSALIQPLEFLYNEGEDVSLLKNFSQPSENKAYIKECVQREMAYMRQAVKCKYSSAKAIAYVTYSKSSKENDDVVNVTINEQADFRQQKKDTTNYKIVPPIVPIQIGINEQTTVLRHGKFLQFEASQKMNGVFVALLIREHEKRRIKKKQDIHSSDSEVNDEKQKRGTKHHGFQLETEARAKLRKSSVVQKSAQTAAVTTTRTSTSKRAKSGIAAKRDQIQTASTPLEKSQLTSQQSKIPTLSEQLASIGKIKGLDTPAPTD
ncbi:unnamed protein product [Didymodactylos carnosus]|uniref:SAM-dependent MTase RsmB/NOP-type domain-containing protein n=1 Tax=Didymodactylos carnosus TaxID=1234261 RepID=A0A814WKF6_9BILA|nr:unnamed protein product [Didymodactylos carnosus]CAF1203462.1 unnamed protein product [Didymodactylos carnosus]CAF3847345.1 unnamed protein product [Didymodactylos carnosus]CAF3967852.1 unnamed protein product [Didymodactylos carnosus]